jgi:hypothetical protein
MAMDFDLVESTDKAAPKTGERVFATATGEVEDGYVVFRVSIADLVANATVLVDEKNPGKKTQGVSLALPEFEYVLETDKGNRKIVATQSRKKTWFTTKVYAV